MSNPTHLFWCVLLPQPTPPPASNPFIFNTAFAAVVVDEDDDDALLPTSTVIGLSRSFLIVLVDIAAIGIFDALLLLLLL